MYTLYEIGERDGVHGKQLIHHHHVTAMFLSPPSQDVPSKGDMVIICDNMVIIAGTRKY